MMKAVNMKNYRFGKMANRMYIGFGILDTETDEFVSHNGKDPFVLTTKKHVQSCIDADWPATLQRVAHA